MIPIKLSNELQRWEVLKHLLSLEREDLRLRFGYTPTEYIITDYVNNSWNKEGHQWFGMYDTAFDGVIATMHIAPMGEETAEIGFTVHEKFRNRGLGTKLFERATTWAQAHDIKKLFMHCLSENKAVRTIAKKNEMHIITIHGGEAEADLVLKQDVLAPIADAVLDRIALYDMLLINQQKLMTNIFRIKQ